MIRLRTCFQPNNPLSFQYTCLMILQIWHLTTKLNTSNSWRCFPDHISRNVGPPSNQISMSVWSLFQWVTKFFASPTVKVQPGWPQCNRRGEKVVFVFLPALHLFGSVLVFSSWQPEDKVVFTRVESSADWSTALLTDSSSTIFSVSLASLSELTELEAAFDGLLALLFFELLVPGFGQIWSTRCRGSNRSTPCFEIMWCLILAIAAVEFLAEHLQSVKVQHLRKVQQWDK